MDGGGKEEKIVLYKDLFTCAIRNVFEPNHFLTLGDVDVELVES
jgi:hypothetical protein